MVLILVELGIILYFLIEGHPGIPKSIDLSAICRNGLLVKVWSQTLPHQTGASFCRGR